MNTTTIEYLTDTWNPIAMRCSGVSPGCDNCWHIRMCKRHVGNTKLSLDVRAAKAGGRPILLAGELEAPLRKRKPAQIGVQFMGDLFHKDVPDEFIDRVFAVMALCPQHTFQVLTKRPERGVEYLDDPICRSYRVFQSGEAMGVFPEEDGYFGRTTVYPLWPLLNVWLGTSVENQAAVNRIDHLVRCPAAVRFLNLEPLLGEVDIRRWTQEGLECSACRWTGCEADAKRHDFDDEPDGWACPECAEPCVHTPMYEWIDWIIVGGESGPGARPMKPDWVRSIRDQCEAAGVPFWFKGWGEWCYPEQMPADTYVEIDSRVNLAGYGQGDDPFRVGKKKAGDLLDGKHHHEWPKGAC